MLGLRHEGDERRHRARRTVERGTRDRRRSERRRAHLRSLIFTGLAFAVSNHTAPHPLELPSASVRSSGPHVSTSIDSVMAVEPARAYEAIIEEAAHIYRVDAALIRSVIDAESAFDPSAVSRAGAIGLMQLMPDIAAAFGVEHPFDPRENIMAGAQLLRELLDQHHGDLSLVLASYNAGTAAVADWGGIVPPFPETQD